MKNHVDAQLLSLALSVALGMASALLYDILRPLRLRWALHRALTHVLDALFALAVLLLFFRLGLGAGGGRLRLYMVSGGVVGALLWWLGPSRVWRSVWAFWLSAAADCVRLLARPFAALYIFAKKGFSFAKKWSTIKAKHFMMSEEEPHEDTGEKKPPIAAGGRRARAAARSQKRAGL